MGMVLTRRKNKEAHHENNVLFHAANGEAMSDFTMFITVYWDDGQYYAVFTRDKPKELTEGQVLAFNIDLPGRDMEVVESLKQLAKIRVQQLKKEHQLEIEHVYGLD